MLVWNCSAVVDDDSCGGLLARAAAKVVEVVMVLTEPERDIGKVVFVGAVESSLMRGGEGPRQTSSKTEEGVEILSRFLISISCKL